MKNIFNRKKVKIKEDNESGQEHRRQELRRRDQGMIVVKEEPWIDGPGPWDLDLRL